MSVADSQDQPVKAVVYLTSPLHAVSVSEALESSLTDRGSGCRNYGLALLWKLWLFPAVEDSSCGQLSPRAGMTGFSEETSSGFA